MAKKSAKTSSSSGTKITRISAGASSSKQKSSTKTKAPAAKETKVAKSKLLSRKKSADTPQPVADKPKKRGPLAAIGRYFKGSWHELRQVRWPDRAATWRMTGALIAFTAFFVLVIILLDAAFKAFFQFILK